MPGNDTSSDDYSDYQESSLDFDDGIASNQQQGRFVVENRARGSIPVKQARPQSLRPTPPTLPIPTTTEEPSQNRGQDLRQPVTSRPRARTPSPSVAAARPVEAPRSFGQRRSQPQPQPRPNTLDAFSAFQTPFDFPRSRIEEIERNRPGRTEAPVAALPDRPRPQQPARLVVEEITTRRPIRIQAVPKPEQPQSFIPRQRQPEQRQQQEQQQQSFIPRQLQNRQRGRGSSGQRLSQVVQEVTEVPTVAPTTQRRPTRPLNFDPRRQRPVAVSQPTANNEATRSGVPTRASIPVRANNLREDAPAAPRRIVVNRQRARGRRPVGTTSINTVITPRPASSAPVTADDSFSSFPARGSSRPLASPTPSRLAPTPTPARSAPTRPVPTQARFAPTPARPAPTPVRPAPSPARFAPTPAARPEPSAVPSALAQLEQIASGQDEPEFTSFPARGGTRQPSRTSSRPESQRTIRINPRPTQSSRASTSPNAASQTSRARPETQRAILPTQAARVTQSRQENSRGLNSPTLLSFPTFQSFSANAANEESDKPSFTPFQSNQTPELANEPIIPTRQPESSRPAFAPTPVPRRTEVNRARPSSSSPSSGVKSSSGVPSRFSSFPVQGRPVLPDSPQVPVVRNPVALPVPQREQPSSQPISLIPQQRQQQPIIPFNPQPSPSRPVVQDPRRVNFDALIQEFTGGQRRPSEPSFFNAIPVEQQQSSPRQFRPQPAVPSLQQQGGASFELVTELLS